MVCKQCGAGTITSKHSFWVCPRCRVERIAPLDVMTTLDTSSGLRALELGQEVRGRERDSLDDYIEIET